MNPRIKLVVLGGSALATPKLFEVIGNLSAEAAYDVVLFGRNRHNLELVKRFSEAVIAGFEGLDIQVGFSTNAREALAGADYILNQIRVGGLEGRVFDETFPRQFGIPGEETVGPGGFSNSLRGIPVVLEYCRMIEEIAPDAVVLNLTNPSSIIQYAMRRYSNVKVIGTCDSPISLMGSIAGMLGKPAAELQFDWVGMHHFGWVVGVKHQGKELLPEVLGRLDELPKLGTDPEIVRAIGAVPAVYLRYYFHSDRILAATEGRTVRGQQLIGLFNRMQAEMEAWKPGDPTSVLDQRGAGWYAKIVVPTLLALAEKRTTELVLSVDNNGLLPWLPERAIVELPVRIQDGQMQTPRVSEVPQDVQGMISRNCAYEMLAAEAIMEKDRDKAMRALLSNLLVSNFNQVRGILEQVWPGETKHTFQMDIPQEEGSVTPFKVPTLYYDREMIEKIHIPEDDFAVITMKVPWEKVKDRFVRQPKAVLFVEELDWYRLESMERVLPEVSAVIGLGGGMAVDAAKYVAWRRHIPVDAVVSITSVDASVTKSIAARAGGHVTYIGYVVPRDVYVDYRLIQGAPPRLNRSGVGDILCAHVALWDWELAHEHIGESYDPAAVAAVLHWLERIEENAAEIREVTEQGVRITMEAFEDISLICRRFGSSRPQEGSDHTFAYNAEFQTGKSFLHGELVALGAYVMANLQENDPKYLARVYERTGIRWQPKDIGLSKDEFIQTLKTLNWYQKNFGRRYSILDEARISQSFIDTLVDQLEF